jgi:endonuclease/exonuclease/phosphatase family metal-dependent hydrolase
MRALRVMTWNVLHRVHAVNWGEAPVEAYPDERARIAGITAAIAEWLAAEAGVVCLQEASGDQLASLRAALGDFAIHDHVYPRLPRIRGEGRLELDDASEHLVTIVGAPGSRRLEGRTFDSDPGKGLLVVDVGDEISIVNTHVSFGERRDAQLALLSQTARRANGGAIVIGDFNAPADVVRSALGEPLAFSDLAGQRWTRIATEKHPGQTIDHVAVVRGTIASASVLDGELLSDHNPVTASVRFG